MVCVSAAVLLLLVTWSMVTWSPVLAQGGGEGDLAGAMRRLEDTVVKDMLHIVNQKFDTLSTRLGQLDTSVNSMLFRTTSLLQKLTGSVIGMSKDLGNVGRQVGHLKVSEDKLKIDMAFLRRDVSQLKVTTSDMLGELESSVVYINDNVDKQTDKLRDDLGDAVTKVGDDVTRMAGEVTSRYLHALEAAPQPESPNCTVDVRGLEGRIDAHFEELKNQTRLDLQRMSNATRATMRSAVMSAIDGEVTEPETLVGTAGFVGSAGGKIGTPTVIPTLTGRPFEKRPYNSNSRQSDQQHNDAYYAENDKQVMDALTNMTGSVLQAVSYFRLTGRMMEKLESNSEVIIGAQGELLRRLKALTHGTLRQIDGNPFFRRAVLRSEELPPELTNHIPVPGGGRRPEGDDTRSFGEEAEAAAGNGDAVPNLASDRQPNKCDLPRDLVNMMTVMAKNGSQLLEVLTDLAQISSVSLAMATSTLNEATTTLKDEVTRVEDLRTNMALMERKPGEHIGQLNSTTFRTLKLVEAIASNSGWLKHIYHDVQHVVNITNRSYIVSSKNHRLLQDMQRKPKGKPLTVGALVPELSKESANDLDPDSMQTIYSTSLQLSRIMPALTKLLAEPDPLFTLVGGGRLDQGRLEVYNKGTWGTMCHRDLGHAEADLICRHLGFKGGISAGAGHFGPGSGGVSWSVNASCLDSGQCPGVIRATEPCSHNMDAGVICDHMLRIKADMATEEPAKQGRLEMHHRGLWLPVCGQGWSGYAARVACQQMGYKDGRESEAGEWLEGEGLQWLSKVSCDGNETRLDACNFKGWIEDCVGWVPAGVRCL